MIKAFFKDSLLYTLANLFTRGIGFLLLPIYTRVISKEEYGLFDYLTTVGLILGVVVTLEITQAIYRFVPEYKNNTFKQSQLASTGFWFSLLMYIVLCVFCFVFASELALILLDDAAYSDLIVITSLLYLANAVLYNFTSLMRAQMLSKKVVLVSSLNAIFVASFSLTFVIYYSQGIQGLILGQLLGVLLSSLISYSIVKQWISFAFCFSALRNMLSFSAPLIFSSIGVVLTMFVDRVMLKGFLGAEQLAGYAVAIKIASIVTLLMVGFQSALTPLIYSNYKKTETPKEIAKLFHFYLVAAFLSLLFLGVVSPWLINSVAGEHYSEAAVYVPPLICSALISSMYLFFPGLILAKKTSVIAVINIFVGGLNVMLNYIFIPLYGALGAAFSTLFSVSLSFVLNALLAQKYYKIPVNLMLIILVFLLVNVLFYWVFF